MGTWWQHWGDKGGEERNWPPYLTCRWLRISVLSNRYSPTYESIRDYLYFTLSTSYPYPGPFLNAFYTFPISLHVVVQSCLSAFNQLFNIFNLILMWGLAGLQIVPICREFLSVHVLCNLGTQVFAWSRV